MSVMDERPPDAAQHVAPLSSVNGPSRAPPMNPMRWQTEPPPLAPGAGAQWLIAALVALGPFSLTISMLGSYIQLVKSRRYLGYLAIAAVPVAGSLSFQTAAPFIIVGELGVHPSE